VGSVTFGISGVSDVDLQKLVIKTQTIVNANRLTFRNDDRIKNSLTPPPDLSCYFAVSAKSDQTIIHTAMISVK
jgi:hypothetical protein